MTALVEVKYLSGKTKYYESIPLISEEKDPLIKVGKFIISDFQKARSRKRITANYRRLLRANEKRIRPDVNRWMAYMIKEIQKGLYKMKGRKASAMVKRLADWDKLKEEGIAMMKPAVMSTLVAGGNSVFRRTVRKQEERFDPIGMAAVNWTNAHAAELVTEVTDATMAAIRAYVADGINRGKSVQTIAMELRPLVGLTEKNIFAVANFEEWLIVNRPDYTVAQIKRSTDVYARRLHRRRAELIARTESSSGLNEGIRQGYGQQGVEKLERVEDPDAPDDDCQENNGRIYTIAEAEGVLPAHPNCLLGDSLISPAGRITAVSKRHYNGEVIIIETASKRKLTCTPNHPILSDRGFCSANTLNVGGYVVSDGLGQRESFEYWKNVNKPARIQDIAESFLENRKMMTCEVPTSRPDFHGDGIGSKVGIVSTNRFLMNRFNASFKQHLLNFQFKRGKIRRILFDCLSMLAFGFPRHLSSKSRFVCRFDLMLSLGFGHMFPSIFGNFACSPDGYISGFKPSYNRASGNIIFRSNSIQSPSRNIKVDNIINGKINTIKPTLVISGTFLDRIIHAETSQYSGFVYNMETTKSYYIANGIANHNCEGSWVAAS